MYVIIIFIIVSHRYDHKWNGNIILSKQWINIILFSDQLYCNKVLLSHSSVIDYLNVSFLLIFYSTFCAYFMRILLLQHLQ